MKTYSQSLGGMTGAAPSLAKDRIAYRVELAEHSRAGSQ